MTEKLLRNPLALAGAFVLSGLLGAGLFALLLAWAPSLAGPAIRSYLLEHPEVLPEAMDRLQARETARYEQQQRGAQKAVPQLLAQLQKPYASAWAGNPDGDVTIVEYFDYQCSYCRTIAPVLADLMKEDGRLRIVLKDWPVFGELSVQAARLVLATKYQNKFHDAHAALMAKTGRLTESRLIGTLKEAGVDMDRLKQALDTHDEVIKAILVRNAAQADAFGFQGTPSFIVGTYRIPGVPTAEQFRLMIADVRAGKDKIAQ